MLNQALTCEMITSALDWTWDWHAILQTQDFWLDKNKTFNIETERTVNKTNACKTIYFLCVFGNQREIDQWCGQYYLENTFFGVKTCILLNYDTFFEMWVALPSTYISSICRPSPPPPTHTHTHLKIGFFSEPPWY